MVCVSFFALRAKLSLAREAQPIKLIAIEKQVQLVYHTHSIYVTHSPFFSIDSKLAASLFPLFSIFVVE
jgi:hypothetical protein